MNGDAWSDQDLVHAVLLPNLQSSYSDFYEKKTEFTEQQARRLNPVGLPTLINHDEILGETGEVVAYVVRDGALPTEAAQAEVLFTLTNPDRAPSAATRSRILFQQQALMNQAHSHVSLSHEWDISLVKSDATGTVTAASAADTLDGGGAPSQTCVIRKRPLEISTCDQGKRAGSRILEYLPAPQTLRSAPPSAIRDFCRIYGFAAPPRDLGTHDDRAWYTFIDTLSNQVSQRRAALFNRNRSSGAHRASSTVVNAKPWQFVEPEEGTVTQSQRLAQLIAAMLPRPAIQPFDAYTGTIPAQAPDP